jgi:cytochrome c-type biogenesis protein CcmH/NrfG
MSDKLQQAIQATRAGDQKNAQFLLTQAIQEEPNNPQSWYLLSLLIDDKEKKQTYLTKVLDIDPEHEKAHQHLATVTETAVLAPEISDEPSVVVATESAEWEAQDAGETLSDWTAVDLPDITDDTREVIADDWDKTETAVAEIILPESAKIEDKQPEERKEVVAKEKKPAKPQPSNGNNLNYMLIALIVIAIIVFLIMAYMIFNMM